MIEVKFHTFLIISSHIQNYEKYSIVGQTLGPVSICWKDRIYTVKNVLNQSVEVQCSPSENFCHKESTNRVSFFFNFNFFCLWICVCIFKNVWFVRNNKKKHIKTTVDKNNNFNWLGFDINVAVYSLRAKARPACAGDTPRYRE